MRKASDGNGIEVEGMSGMFTWSYRCASNSAKPVSKVLSALSSPAARRKRVLIPQLLGPTCSARKKALRAAPV